MNRHEELPPLSETQRAETLRLAARLQADYEARTSSEALLRAAAEAGIEARFVREAALQVSRSTERGSVRRTLPRPLVAIGALTVLNWNALVAQPAESWGVRLEVWQIAALGAASFAAALWVGREPKVRWTMPLAVVAIWIALALPDAVYHQALEGRSLPWLPALIAIVGGSQFVGALLGAFLWNYEPRARSGRRFRPGLR